VLIVVMLQGTPVIMPQPQGPTYETLHFVIPFFRYSMSCKIKAYDLWK